MKVEIKTNPERLKSLVVGNKIFRSACDCELTPEDLEKARKELNETEEVRNSSLRTLREKLLEDDEFNYRTDDEYLLHYLRSRKFNCQEAYQMMHYFYNLSKDYPEVFASLPSNLETLLNSRRFSILPYRDEEGSPIIIDKVGTWNTKTQSVYNLLQYFQTIVDIYGMNPSWQIDKTVAILDFKGATMNTVAAFLNPNNIVFLLKVIQNVYAWRLKYLFLINSSRIGYIILKTCRSFLKTKIADRIIVLGSDMKELHRYLSPSILPKEYGGHLDDSECNFTQHIMDNVNYLKYTQSFRHPKKI